MEITSPSGQYSTTLNQMLKQLKHREITLDEYLIKCAYWGMRALDDIYFMSLPSKTSEVREYEDLSYYKREKLTQEFYSDNPGIMWYYDKVNYVKVQNKTSFFKLESIKKNLPKTDIKNHEKLDMRILEFKEKMEGY